MLRKEFVSNINFESTSEYIVTSNGILFAIQQAKIADSIEVTPWNIITGTHLSNINLGKEWGNIYMWCFQNWLIIQQVELGRLTIINTDTLTIVHRFPFVVGNLSMCGQQQLIGKISLSNREKLFGVIHISSEARTPSPSSFHIEPLNISYPNPLGQSLLFKNRLIVFSQSETGQIAFDIYDYHMIHWSINFSRVLGTNFKYGESIHCIIPLSNERIALVVENCLTRSNKILDLNIFSDKLTVWEPKQKLIFNKYNPLASKFDSSTLVALSECQRYIKFFDMNTGIIETGLKDRSSRDSRFDSVCMLDNIDLVAIKIKLRSAPLLDSRITWGPLIAQSCNIYPAFLAMKYAPLPTEFKSIILKYSCFSKVFKSKSTTYPMIVPEAKIPRIFEPFIPKAELAAESKEEASSTKYAPDKLHPASKSFLKMFNNTVEFKEEKIEVIGSNIHPASR